MLMHSAIEVLLISSPVIFKELVATGKKQVNLGRIPLITGSIDTANLSENLT